MVRTLLAGAIAVALIASPVSAQGFRWWLEPEVRRALALTPAQVDALQREHDRTIPQRQALRLAFDQAAAELSEALTRADLSDAEGERLVGRVEDLRRDRNIARVRLLVSLYFLLTPQQRVEFRKMSIEGFPRPAPTH